MKEAVWFKDGQEVMWIDPVISAENESLGPKYVKVNNGFYDFQSGDGAIPSDVDDFVIREKPKQVNGTKVSVKRIESILNRNGLSMYSDSEKTRYKAISDILDDIATIFHAN